MLRKLLATACFAMCLAAPAKAENWTLMGEKHNVSISSAQTGLCPSGSNYIVIQVTGANAYYTLNTSTPSSTNGFTLSQNSSVSFSGTILVGNLSVIQASSGAVLQVLCAVQTNQ